MIRNRFLYALWIVLAMGAGLIWRSHLLPLSPFMRKYGGDAWWALLVFFGFGFLFTKIPTLRLALIALGFAWAIEFAQLYHTPWLDSVRSTRLGHLILGSTFNWPDLIAYAAGIALGAGIEYAMWPRGFGRMKLPEKM